MTSNKALIIIDSHIRRYYLKPVKTYGMDRFQYREADYKNWAATEIRKYINEHRKSEPINAVEDFRYMMDHLACAAKDAKRSYMFSVGYDVATDILDVLLGGE